MNSSVIPFYSVITPSLKRPSLLVRAQAQKDREGSGKIVDANLRVLRERIEDVKIRERLERCCKIENGWNYAPGYGYCELKRSKEISQMFRAFWFATGTFGLTIFTASLSLCLFSLLIHMN